MDNIVLKDDERQPVECWTRVMGYFRPISHFNKGKKSEFAERVWFDENKVIRACETVEETKRLSA
ncbi:MAG: hypothetical protein IKY98_04610 [Alphaproteobacteria bacterium]|nr:hypothetical protein [Alphaproteobacteria bacterium]